MRKHSERAWLPQGIECGWGGGWEKSHLDLESSKWYFHTGNKSRSHTHPPKKLVLGETEAGLWTSELGPRHLETLANSKTGKMWAHTLPVEVKIQTIFLGGQAIWQHIRSLKCVHISCHSNFTTEDLFLENNPSFKDVHCEIILIPQNMESN